LSNRRRDAITARGDFGARGGDRVVAYAVDQIEVGPKFILGHPQVETLGFPVETGLFQSSVVLQGETNGFGHAQR